MSDASGERATTRDRSRRAARLEPAERVDRMVGVNRSIWPNLATASRIALAPAIVAAAFAGSRLWFAGWLGLALFTDVLDGYLARRLQAYSELGRKLDSISDYVTLAAGLAGLCLLWPEMMRREWPWFAAAIGAFALALLVTGVRLRRVPCYHTWMTKAGVFGIVFSMVPLLAGWTPVPARSVAVFEVLVGLEQIAIAFLVPWHRGEMRSAWHAWRMRQARAEG